MPQGDQTNTRATWTIRDGKLRATVDLHSQQRMVTKVSSHLDTQLFQTVEHTPNGKVQLHAYHEITS